MPTCGVWTVLSALVFLVAGCAIPAADGGAFCGYARPERSSASAVPTWHQDVAPIVNAYCSRCHRAGGVASFSLDTYAQVFAGRAAVARSVRARTMPPYLAVPCCAEYQHPWGLSDEQVATVLDWVEGGAPEGDATRPGPAIPMPTAGLSRRDVSLVAPAPYAPAPAAGSTDDTRCFVFDWPVSTPTFVTGVETESSERSMLHHVIVAAISGADVAAVLRKDAADPAPGFACNDGVGALRGVTILGGGLTGGDFPDGIGTPIAPGSKIILNIHYSVLTARPGAMDRPSVHFRTDANARPAESLLLTNPAWIIGDAMRIRAGDRDAMLYYRYKPRLFTRGRRMLLRNVAPHMHTYGTSITVRVLRANGARACVLEIPRWRFGWEQTYWLANPIAIDPEDELYLECHFDNSADNQPVPGSPPRDFAFGGNSQDMCAAFLSMTEAQR